MGAIAQAASELAISEWRDRWQRGTGTEEDPHFKPFVRDYWVTLNPNFAGREDDRTIPWSAAFISFLFRKSGATSTQFPFSEGHHTYIHRGDAKFLAGDLTADLVAFKVDERRPLIGDLVVYWRETRRRLHQLPAGGFKSHTNIIVEMTGTQIVTIGGNLADSVHKRMHHLDSDGHLVMENDMMGFLQVNF